MKKVMMKSVCSYCNKETERKWVEYPDGYTLPTMNIDGSVTSHGVCQSCFTIEMGKLKQTILNMHIGGR